MYRLPVQLRHQYESDFRLADEAYGDGRVALTTPTQEKYWNYQERYVWSLGLDPHHQGGATKQPNLITQWIFSPDPDRIIPQMG